MGICILGLKRYLVAGSSKIQRLAPPGSKKQGHHHEEVLAVLSFSGLFQLGFHFISSRVAILDIDLRTFSSVYG